MFGGFGVQEPPSDVEWRERGGGRGGAWGSENFILRMMHNR